MLYTRHDSSNDARETWTGYYFIQNKQIQSDFNTVCPSQLLISSLYYYYFFSPSLTHTRAHIRKYKNRSVRLFVSTIHWLRTNSMTNWRKIVPKRVRTIVFRIVGRPPHLTHSAPRPLRRYIRIDAIRG